MAKYYISDGVEKTVLEADNPLEACFSAIRYRFQGVPVNGFYKISEMGFERHDDDIMFSSDEVVSALLEVMEEERRKNERNPENE